MCVQMSQARAARSATASASCAPTPASPVLRELARPWSTTMRKWRESICRHLPTTGPPVRTGFRPTSLSGNTGLLSPENPGSWPWKPLVLALETTVLSLGSRVLSWGTLVLSVGTVFLPLKKKQCLGSGPGSPFWNPLSCVVESWSCL